MSGTKQRVTLNNLSEPQQVRELNRQLSWIWDQLLGGLSMKSLSASARAVIASKASGEEVESLVQQRAEEILLEVRKPASAVDTGSGVLINEKGVYVTGGEVDLRTNDGEQYLNITPECVEASEVRSPTVAARYDGAVILFVDGQATGEQLETGNYYRSLADVCAVLSGRHLDGNVVVMMAEGMIEYGNLSIVGICGSGSVTVKGTGSMVQGALVLGQCAVPVRLEGLSVVCALGDALTVRSMYAEVSQCSLKSAADGHAVSVRRGARLRCEGCVLTAQGCAGYVDETSQAVFADCRGAGTLMAAGMMIASGTVPVGGCVNAGGLMSAANVVETGAEGEAPEVQEQMTAHYPMTHSDSYAGGSWSFFSDADIRQGITGNSGRIYGCIWFDTAAMREQLSGKVVQQVSLRLKMQSGYGRGVAVSVQLYGTGMAYDGRTGAPTLVTEYGTIGSASPGEVNVITVPNRVAEDLAAGVICGLVLRSDDTEKYNGRAYSKNYARFDGQTSGTEESVPCLTVTAGGRASAAAICGQVLCGEAICGEE